MTVENNHNINVLANQLVTALKKKNLHVSMAESCTGGAIGSAIVSVSGASDVFSEGYITYSEKAKHDILGVSYETIEKYGVVSEETALEMSGGLQKISGADICISVTGYADGDRDVAGSVYIGIMAFDENAAYHFRFEGDRNEVREQAVHEAIRLALKQTEDETIL